MGGGGGAAVDHVPRLLRGQNAGGDLGTGERGGGERGGEG